LRALGLLDHDASLPPVAGPQVLPDQSHGRAGWRRRCAELRAQHPVIHCSMRAAAARLTLLIAWCAKHVWAHPIEVLGVDRNAAGSRRAGGGVAGATDDVCGSRPGGSTRARSSLLDPAFGGTNAPVVHGVFALHACDHRDLRCARPWGSRSRRAVRSRAVLPRRAARGAWSALAARRHRAHSARSGELRICAAETAAHITDAMRALLVRAAGYECEGDGVSCLARAHPQNTLIRASSARPVTAEALAAYEALRTQRAAAASRWRRGWRPRDRLERIVDCVEVSGSRFNRARQHGDTVIVAERTNKGDQRIVRSHSELPAHFLSTTAGWNRSGSTAAGLSIILCGDRPHASNSSR